MGKTGFGIYEKTLYFLDPEYEKTFFRQNVPISRENRKRPGGEVLCFSAGPMRYLRNSSLQSSMRGWFYILLQQFSDLLDKNKKSEPFANRLQVRISPIWKGRTKKIPTFSSAFGGISPERREQYHPEAKTISPVRRWPYHSNGED